MGKITKQRAIGKVKHPSSVAPKAHASSHENGGSDEITALGLAGLAIPIGHNAKIADINESDTNKHTLDLATLLSETREIIAIIGWGTRISGSGVLIVYPNEGSIGIENSSAAYLPTVIIADGTNRLQYSQNVANDDIDYYCVGYFVESA